ncbi:MAG: methyltransferase [Thermoanaerobaculia bacterium]
MSLVFQPTPRDPRVDRFLAGLQIHRWDAKLFLACELVDRYARDQAITLARELEIEAPLAEGASVDELAERRGFVPAFRPALDWLLRRLAADDLLESSAATPDGPRRYRLTRPMPAPELAELRAAGLAADPANAPTFDLFDAAAAAWPAVARGEGTGEHILFGLGRLPLWLAYFHNDNPVYAVNNLLAAVVGADALRPGPGARLLEVGAGAGSATEALLDELQARGRLADLASYRMTEPSAFFRRRAERRMAEKYPGLPLVGAALDIDLPLAEQGVAPASCDLVLAVNVLHVARDLRRALLELRAALAPGGVLVAGEGMRLFPAQPIPAELVFLIFSSFTSVELDPQIRPTHGFLSPEDWIRAFTAAGFEDVAVVPDLVRLREVYPRFFAGAVRGRAAAAK